MANPRLLFTISLGKAQGSQDVELAFDYVVIGQS